MAVKQTATQALEPFNSSTEGFGIISGMPSNSTLVEMEVVGTKRRFGAEMVWRVRACAKWRRRLLWRGGDEVSC